MLSQVVCFWWSSSMVCPSDRQLRQDVAGSGLEGRALPILRGLPLTACNGLCLRALKVTGISLMVSILQSHHQRYLTGISKIVHPKWNFQILSFRNVTLLYLTVRQHAASQPCNRLSYLCIYSVARIPPNWVFCSARIPVPFQTNRLSAKESFICISSSFRTCAIMLLVFIVLLFQQQIDEPWKIVTMFARVSG